MGVTKEGKAIRIKVSKSFPRMAANLGLLPRNRVVSVLRVHTKPVLGGLHFCNLEQVVLCPCALLPGQMRVPGGRVVEEAGPGTLAGSPFPSLWLLHCLSSRGQSGCNPLTIGLCWTRSEGREGVWDFVEVPVVQSGPLGLWGAEEREAVGVGSLGLRL